MRSNAMNYKKVDIDSWEHGHLYKLYTTDLKLTMDLTVEVDVTRVVEYSRRRGMKFYPIMIWLVSKIMNSHEEYRYAYDDEGELILWDSVSPSYTDFNTENKHFSKFVTEYSDDLDEFYARSMADRERYKDYYGFVPNQPKNFFDITCLPWVSYKHLNINVYGDGLSLFPVVMWGKWEERGGRLVMPVTLKLHHATGDGYHLSRFFLELEEMIKSL